jgi:hypothetical protein
MLDLDIRLISYPKKHINEPKGVKGSHTSHTQFNGKDCKTTFRPMVSGWDKKFGN